MHGARRTWHSPMTGRSCAPEIELQAAVGLHSAETDLDIVRRLAVTLRGTEPIVSPR